MSSSAEWRSRYTRLEFTDHDNGVVLVTLNNPGKLNATDEVMHAELATVFIDLDRDPDVRVVVVTGEGNAFSAGGDLEWITKQVGNYPQTMTVMKEAGDIVRTLIECDTPVVSAINGVAVGAGLAVALMADISIIDRAAKFTDGHIRLGVAAGDHAVAIWPLLCGMAKAKYYLMTADFIDGAEAERIGLDQKQSMVMTCCPKRCESPRHLQLARTMPSSSQNEHSTTGCVRRFQHSRLHLRTKC